MDRAKALLEGGQVQRFHATPHTRPYSVAEHSWGMAMLLLALYHKEHRERCSKALLWACLTHDVAERWIGDMPAPVKWDVAPACDIPLTVAEEHINKSLNIHFALNAHDKRWLKALDLAELFVYCATEVAMGNKLLDHVRITCWNLLQDVTWVPWPVTEWINGFDAAERTPDNFGMREGNAPE